MFGVMNLAVSDPSSADAGLACGWDLTTNSIPSPVPYSFVCGLLSMRGADASDHWSLQEDTCLKALSRAKLVNGSSGFVIEKVPLL